MSDTELKRLTVGKRSLERLISEKKVSFYKELSTLEKELNKINETIDTLIDGWKQKGRAGETL
jgi:hypothetical protein